MSRGYENRLHNSFKYAPVVPFYSNSKIILFSDCHRGTGTSNDNLLKNQHLYYAALKYYYDHDFIYIELGDGDELWENRSYSTIHEVHADVFHLLSRFQKCNRLHMIYGNHDYELRNNKELTYYQGIILKECQSEFELYLTHGNQVDFLNSVLWRLSRFLVRYVWKPLEQFGVLDPTSAAKSYKIKAKSEKRLSQWAIKNNHYLVTGHTHRPMLGNKETKYFNTGSCVHPGGITCIEVVNKEISLIKWSMETKEDNSLYVARTVLAGPVKFDEL